MQKHRYTMKYIDKELARIKAWKATDPVRRRAAYSAYSRREKERFIAAYGGSCQCCSESNFEFLSMEHINGRSPKEKYHFGARAYRLARNEGYPKDKYQLLCMNCNFARGKYGVCPHESSRLQVALGRLREEINEAVA